MPRQSPRRRDIGDTDIRFRFARFVIGALAVVAGAVPAEALDELHSWLRGASGRANGSSVQAQVTETSKPTEAPAPDKNWSVNPSLKTYYDSWRNNQGEKGSQFAEAFALGFDMQGLRPSHSLSIFLDGGAVQGEITRGRSSTSLEVPIDTIATVKYSTFDYAITQGNNAGVELGLNFNLPTGKTRLTELELASVPNGNVVSKSPLGAGFNVGLEGKYLQQADRLRLYTGAGYTRRGAYDQTRERSDDTVAAGDEYRFSLGGGYQFNSLLNLEMEGTYARIQGIADQDGNSLGFRVPATLKLGKFTTTGQYSFTYSDTAPSKSTTVIRQAEFQKGFSNTGNVTASYQLLDSLTVKALGEGSVNDFQKPADPTFFTTDSRYAFGAGGSWVIPDAPLGLRLDGEAKYFQVFSESSTSASTRFSGFSFLVELAANF